MKIFSLKLVLIMLRIFFIKFESFVKFLNTNIFLFYILGNSRSLKILKKYPNANIKNSVRNYRSVYKVVRSDGLMECV